MDILDTLDFAPAVSETIEAKSRQLRRRVQRFVISFFPRRPPILQLQRFFVVTSDISEATPHAHLHSTLAKLFNILANRSTTVPASLRQDRLQWRTSTAVFLAVFLAVRWK
jgi:hypothetical protein